VYGMLDFNWVCLMSSADINFYELTGAKSASQGPQSNTKKRLQSFKLFLALSVFGNITNPSFWGK